VSRSEAGCADDCCFRLNAGDAVIRSDIGDQGAGALTWGALEWSIRRKPSALGMISGAVAGLGTITPGSGFVFAMAGHSDRNQRRPCLLLGLYLAQTSPAL
jgi:Ammonium Transporter Family